MQQYGEPIGGYSQDKEIIYSTWVSYFSNPTMIKIKDVHEYSMYMTKTHCLLSKECRYLIALVTKDTMSVGTPEELKNLQWKSFQTRTLRDKHDLQPHFFTPRAVGIMASKLNRIKTTDESSTYTSDTLPIVVTMLHEKPGHSEYYDRGTLAAALETYYTVVTFEA
jgi:hypothetical protein